MDFRDVSKYVARSATETQRVENAHLDERSAAPPPETGWRYRRVGAPRWFALAGVAVGLALFVVPGLFALRSYLRWERGVVATPVVAWALAALGVWGLLAVGIWFIGFPPVAVVTSIVAVPVICLAAWRI